MLLLCCTFLLGSCRFVLLWGGMRQSVAILRCIGCFRSQQWRVPIGAGARSVKVLSRRYIASGDGAPPHKNKLSLSEKLGIWSNIGTSASFLFGAWVYVNEKDKKRKEITRKKADEFVIKINVYKSILDDYIYEIQQEDSINNREINKLIHEIVRLLMTECGNKFMPQSVKNHAYRLQQEIVCLIDSPDTDQEDILRQLKNFHRYAIFCTRVALSLSIVNPTYISSREELIRLRFSNRSENVDIPTIFKEYNHMVDGITEHGRSMKPRNLPTL